MQRWHDHDYVWMNLALVEARRGLGRVEPNPLVGAVVASESQLIGVGHHQAFGQPHAEVNALAQAGSAACGATLYVTLEPCCHHGKTPPCTDAIRQTGIRRVVAAMRDPFPTVDGGGIRELESAEIEVECGLLEEAARQLNGPFIKRVITGRPYVIAKWAMTLDGKIATSNGDSRWISNEQSRAWVHELRGRMDAIIVGIGTVLADDPQLTARPPGPRAAVRVVLDSQLRIPSTSRLVRTAREVPLLIACTKPESDWPPELIAAGCEIVSCPCPNGRHVDIGWLLELLAKRGATNVLVEGGSRVLGQFFDAGEIDAVEVFIAPKVHGGEGLSPLRGESVTAMNDLTTLARYEVQQLGCDVHLTGTYSRPWQGALDTRGACSKTTIRSPVSQKSVVSGVLES